jgi:hypothetical protein
MTDKDIEAATSVPIRTLHRWQGNGLGPQGPNPDLVFRFADGMGEKRETAQQLLEWASEPVAPAEPEPIAPPEIHVLMRRLNDPAIAKSEKDLIRETLRMLVARRPKPVGKKADGE